MCWCCGRVLGLAAAARYQVHIGYIHFFWHCVKKHLATLHEDECLCLHHNDYHAQTCGLVCWCCGRVLGPVSICSMRLMHVVAECLSCWNENIHHTMPLWNPEHTLEPQPCANVSPTVLSRCTFGPARLPDARHSTGQSLFWSAVGLQKNAQRLTQQTHTRPTTGSRAHLACPHVCSARQSLPLFPSRPVGGVLHEKKRKKRQQIDKKMLESWGIELLTWSKKQIAARSLPFRPCAPSQDTSWCFNICN